MQCRTVCLLLACLLLLQSACSQTPSDADSPLEDIAESKGESFLERFERERAEFDRKRAEKKRLALVTLDGMAKKHDALSEAEWRKRFSRSGVVRYSLELQEGIRAVNGKAIIIVVGIVDVAEERGSHFVVGEDNFGATFILKTSEAIARKIIEAPVNSYSEVRGEGFALAVKLYEVRILYTRQREVSISEIPFHELDISSYPDGEAEIRNKEEVTEMVERDAYVEERGLYPAANVVGECFDAEQLDGVERYDFELVHDDVP
jgi:hypothetical protein